LKCHLPRSQQDFFTNTPPPGLVEVRAEFYDDEAFEKTNKDSILELRPDYLL
jgi:hypothetical protein